MTEFKKEFLDQSVHFISLNPPRIKICLDQLTEEEVWKKTNTQTNSIGNLILHLCGNITQYIHSSLGKENDVRKRDLEFSIEGGFSKKELFEKINTVTLKAIKIIESQSVNTLLQKRLVQGFEYTGIGIIIHVTEHYSYHVGQIAQYTKLLKNNNLGFYADYDLNTLNE